MKWETLGMIGAPEEIRTPDPQIRSLVLHLPTGGPAVVLLTESRLRSELCLRLRQIRLRSQAASWNSEEFGYSCYARSVARCSRGAGTSGDPLWLAQRRLHAASAATVLRSSDGDWAWNQTKAAKGDRAFRATLSQPRPGCRLLRLRQPFDVCRLDTKGDHSRPHPGDAPMGSPRDRCGP
jgi:hypothetical protein